MAEVKTYRCDVPKCGNTSEKINQVKIAYVRTDEEIKQLVDAENAHMGAGHLPITFDEMQRSSVVEKRMDVCDEHYVELKTKYFA